MPTYTVTVARDEVGSFSSGSGRDALRVGYNVSYFVDVDDPNPENIGPFDVMAATGLPKVNRTVYSNNGYIIPWLVCRQKTARRLSSKRARWQVDTVWDSGTNGNDQRESDNTPIAAPAAITSITPRVEQSLDVHEEELYEDKAEPSQKIILPTGTSWIDPAVERLGTLKLKITQYESSLTYQQQIDRVMRVNSSEYRTKEKYTWLIENIDATEVEVTLSGGDTTAVLVTYHLHYTPRTGGWRDRRVLRDTHYKAADGKLYPFADSTGLSRQNYIRSNGTPKGEGEEPSYIEYETYDTIDFDGFLQV